VVKLEVYMSAFPRIWFTVLTLLSASEMLRYPESILKRRFPALEKRNQMMKCLKCGAETQMFDNGVPLCVACAEAVDSARKKTAQARTELHESGQAYGAHT
jgi:hypothetical protein